MSKFVYYTFSSTMRKLYLTFMIYSDDCMYPLINEKTRMTATSSMPGRGPENARLQGVLLFSLPFLNTSLSTNNMHDNFHG